MKTREEYVSCPICNRDITESFRTENGFNLVKCRGCGLIYVNPRSVQGGLLDELYTDYSDKRYSEEIDNCLRRKYLTMLKAQRLFHDIRRLKKSGRMLDIGFGASYYLVVAKKLGYEPYGLELCSTFCDYARNEFGLNVSLETIHEAHYPDNYFDVIIMINVISHLDTPIKDSFEINRVLKKDGLFVLQTGNWGELNKEWLKKCRGSWHVPEYLCWYSEDNLRAFLKKTHFEPIKIDKYSTVLPQLITNSKLAPSIRAIARRGKIKLERKGYGRDYPGGQVGASIFARIYARIHMFIVYFIGKWLNRPGSPATLIIYLRECFDEGGE